ncbi:MAG: hypothetical protein JW809_10350 [Pirellulales bacterium]|nr:hypothetical protein [Pirellulales bacterium]
MTEHQTTLPFAPEAPPPPLPARAGPGGCRAEAQRRIRPEGNRLRSVVYHAIRAAGAEGMTDPEVSITTGLLSDTSRARRVELVQAGVVVDSGRRRQTQSGRWATVWVARPPAEPPT